MKNKQFLRANFDPNFRNELSQNCESIFFDRFKINLQHEGIKFYLFFKEWICIFHKDYLVIIASSDIKSKV